MDAPDPWPGAPSRMAPPPYAPPPPKPYGNPADGLILAGAIVGLAFAGLGILMALFQLVMWRSLAEFFSRNETAAREVPVDAFQEFMRIVVILSFVAAIVTLVGAILMFRARTRLKRSLGADGRTAAIVGAVVMIVGMNWIAGGLALIGALLVEAPRPVTTPLQG